MAKYLPEVLNAPSSYNKGWGCTNYFGEIYGEGFGYGHVPSYSRFMDSGGSGFGNGNKFGEDINELLLNFSFDTAMMVLKI